MGPRELHKHGHKRALIVVEPERLPQVRGALLRHGVETIALTSCTDGAAIAADERVHLLVVETDDARRPAALDLATTLKAAWGTAVVFLARQLTVPIAHDMAGVDADGVVCVPLDSRQLDATLQLALARPERQSGRASRERERALADALDRVAGIVSELGYGRDVQSAPSLGPRLARLRPRERQVVQLLLAHHRVPAIANQLAISPQTVRNHLKSAFKRSSTRSQQELLDWLRSTDPIADSATDLVHSNHRLRRQNVDFLPDQRTGSVGVPSRRVLPGVACADGLGPEAHLTSHGSTRGERDED